MEHFLGPTGIARADTATFFAEIARIFGDSDEGSIAARELEKLRQTNRDFSRYYAGFIRLVALLPGMSDRSKKRVLEKGLSSELLDSLQCRMFRPMNLWLPLQIGSSGWTNESADARGRLPSPTPPIPPRPLARSPPPAPREPRPAPTQPSEELANNKKRQLCGTSICN